MEKDRYTLRARVDAQPGEVEQRVRDALQSEGFGVLTEIDVQATLKQKLDVDVDPYVILGACNPPLAHQALDTDPAIGALLPCNVVVRAHPDGGSEIIAIDALQMLGLADAPGLDPIAKDVATRLERVLSTVAG